MYMGARESCLRACATLLCHARVKNKWDKPLLDVNEILIHGYVELKRSNMERCICVSQNLLEKQLYDVFI